MANYAGVFEKIKFSEENSRRLKMVRKYVVNTVDDFRQDVRRVLNPKKVKDNIDVALTKERMATLGFATGAFAGFAL